MTIRETPIGPIPRNPWTAPARRRIGSVIPACHPSATPLPAPAGQALRADYAKQDACVKNLTIWRRPPFLGRNPRRNRPIPTFDARVKQSQFPGARVDANRFPYKNLGAKRRVVRVRKQSQWPASGRRGRRTCRAKQSQSAGPGRERAARVASGLTGWGRTVYCRDDSVRHFQERA